MNVLYYSLHRIRPPRPSEGNPSPWTEFHISDLFLIGLPTLDFPSSHDVRLRVVRVSRMPSSPPEVVVYLRRIRPSQGLGYPLQSSWSVGKVFRVKPSPRLSYGFKGCYPSTGLRTDLNKGPPKGRPTTLFGSTRSVLLERRSSKSCRRPPSRRTVDETSLRGS